MFVKLDGHIFLEVLGVLSPSLVDLIENSDNHVQSLCRFGFFDIILGRFNAFQRNPLAGSSDMGKDAVLNGVVLGTVRQIVVVKYFRT